MRKEGYIGEVAACRILERNGYTILSNNFCVRGGEIDIIASAPDGVIVFVEVKLRAAEPIDHRALVPRRKIVCMHRAAAAWCAINGAPRGRRCDLLLIVRGRKAVWYKGIGL